MVNWRRLTLITNDENQNFRLNKLFITVNGVVVRNVEWYDLVKIKPTESETELAPSLTIQWKLHSESVGVATRSTKINQSQRSIPGPVIGWFFSFCLRLWKSSFHGIKSDEVVNGIKESGNVLILPTPIPSSLWLHLRFWFAIFTRS